MGLQRVAIPRVSQTKGFYYAATLAWCRVSALSSWFCTHLVLSVYLFTQDLSCSPGCPGTQSLELTVTLLPQLPKCWNPRQQPPLPAESLIPRVSADCTFHAGSLPPSTFVYFFHLHDVVIL